ncbi:MAG: phosphoribosylformylglycinamidine synthase subunit PurS [Deltaproteobacteria bacterium]|nr:phosphoribosylformylglycinamidine synthase subunit PurS [Deltaproteobacteria bacterium]
MKVNVYVTLKKGVLDPQGKAVAGALVELGFKGLRGLKIGKFMELDLDVQTAQDARKLAEEMCRKLLANTVIEDFRVEVEG